MFFSVGPSSVRLKYGERRWLSVGKSYLIQCEAVGSRPKAAITWWIDGKLVSETRTFFHILHHIKSNSLQWKIYCVCWKCCYITKLHIKYPFTIFISCLFAYFWAPPQKGKISNSRWLRFCWLVYPWACKIAISAIAQWTTISDFEFAVRRVQLKISISRLLHIEASKLALMYLSQNFTLDLLFHCSNEQDDKVHFF